MRVRYDPKHKHKSIYTRHTIIFIMLIGLILLVLMILMNRNGTMDNNNNDNDRFRIIDYGINPISEKHWGHIYSPSRIWCLVPSLYPRNADNMRVCLFIIYICILYVK